MSNQKPIPFTTFQKCVDYQTFNNSCICEDHRNGGSYTDPTTGESVCKHIYAVRYDRVLPDGFTSDEISALNKIMKIQTVFPIDQMGKDLKSVQRKLVNQNALVDNLKNEVAMLKRLNRRQAVAR